MAGDDGRGGEAVVAPLPSSFDSSAPSFMGNDREDKSETSSGRKFSILVSTEENNRSYDMRFYGPFAHIRKTLDYNYHKNYRMERQWLQDAIIEEFLETVHLTDVNGDVCTTPTEPWIVFTAGAMGAGKSHTINWLVEKGLFPLLAFVNVDPDEIRRRLPEFNLYAEVIPEKAGELTRKEAGYVAEILTFAALQAGKNVLVDGSLRDSVWYTQYFAQLRREYPNNKIAILHIVAPREAVFQRAADRAKLTGRVVPRHTLELALEQVPRSVKILAPLADYFCELNNAPGKDIEIVTEGEDWDDFQVQWLQTCAWVPGMRKKTFGTRHRASEDGLKAKERKRENLHGSERNLDASSIEDMKRLSVVAMRAAPPRRRIDRQISLMLSTEQNHRCESLTFYGPYSHIRETLDYTYHENYCKDRQWLQDMIVKEVLKTGGIEERIRTPDPWLIFAVGVSCVGKKHTLKELISKKFLSLNGLIIINKEKIRSFLPEFVLYADRNPAKAASLTRKEVGYISEIVSLAALQAGKNVVELGVLEDAAWYKEKLFPQLRNAFPTLRIAILHIVAPIDDVIRRTEHASAAETTGEVSHDEVEAEHVKIQSSVDELRPSVDYCCEIDNPDGTGLLISTQGETWDTFKSMWSSPRA